MSESTKNTRRASTAVGSMILIMSAAAYSDTTSGQLDEIIVTATKRQLNVQDVPVSINALSSVEMERARIDSPIDLGVQTSGLQLGTEAGGLMTFIRGVGSGNLSAGQESAVPLYIDGVYQASPYATISPFNNIDHIEVLKGPQGTLFGRNATGGLINVITKDPSFTPTLDARVSYGNYETVITNVYAATGITDTLAVDIAGYYIDQGEGWGINVNTGNPVDKNREVEFRTKILFQPVDSTKIVATVDHTGQRTSQGYAYAVAPGATAFDGSHSQPNYYNINASVDPYQQLDTTGAALTIRQSFPKMDLVSISSYRNTVVDFLFDNDDAPPVVSTIGANEQIQRTITQEFHLVSTWNSPFQVVGGVFYYKDRSGFGAPQGLTIRGSSVASPGSPGVNLLGVIDSNSKSVFSEGNYAFTDADKLTVGLRYTKDDRVLRGGTQVVGDDDVPIVTIPNARQQASYGQTTYRVIYDHKFTPDVMAYVSQSHGFKSGDFNTVNAANPAFKPETLDATEVGVKSELLDHRLRLNSALYYYDYKELQLVEQDVNTQFTINIPKATIYGLDLDGEFKLSNDISLRFGGTAMNPKYGTYPNAPCEVPAAGGGNTLVVGGCDATGHQLLRASKYTTYGGLDYDLATSVGKFSTDAIVSYRSSFPWKPDGRLVQSSYTILNATVTWTPNNSPFSLTLWGKNLLSEHYSSFTDEDPTSDFINAAPPLTFGIEGRVKL